MSPQWERILINMGISLFSAWLKSWEQRKVKKQIKERKKELNERIETRRGANDNNGTKPR